MLVNGRNIILLFAFFVLQNAFAQRDSVQRFVVHGIIIVGNEVTKERVIMRELLVQEGDTLNKEQLYDKLQRSQQNLQNTRLFNSVIVIPAFINSAEVLVQVQVNERWYLWPIPIFEIADPNFNTWWLEKDFRRTNYGAYLTRYNFRGLNEKLYLKLRFGYSKQFALQYTKPFFDRDQRWGTDAELSYFQNNEITIGTRENKRIFYSPEDGNSREEWKGELGFTLRRTHDLRHRWKARYTAANVVDTVTFAAPDYFGGGDTRTQFITLGYRLILDHRDSRNFTAEGHIAELDLEHAGVGVLEQNAPNITTAYVKGTKWFGLPKNLTFSSTASYKHSFGGSVPYYVQSALGYDRFVRGFELYVIDGQRSALLRQNLTYPIVKPLEQYVKSIPFEAFRTFQFALYADLFFDAGYVWDDQYAEVNFLANEWMSGYGLGLDIVTSYDMIFRGEFTINSLGERGFFLHFTHPF